MAEPGGDCRKSKDALVAAEAPDVEQSKRRDAAAGVRTAAGMRMPYGSSGDRVAPLREHLAQRDSMRDV